MGDWYYIGHYGQLGPLTRDQIDELVQGGVIARDTYVWRQGMDNWLPADRVSELSESFRAAQPFAPPPPPPTPGFRAPAPPVQSTTTSFVPSPFFVPQESTPAPGPAYYPTFGGIQSDRSRTAAGILQLFLPGVGRMYLGYLAYGVLQLVVTVGTCGFLYLWSFIDGIVILTGGLKMDGYGRSLRD